MILQKYSGKVVILLIPETVLLALLMGLHGAVKLKMRLLIIEGDFCACNALDWASS